MRPQNENGKEWGVEASNLAFNDIRTVVIDDLRKRDETLSGGKMNAENGWAPYMAVPKKQADDGKEVVAAGMTAVLDPVSVSVRHSGDDTDNLARARWAEFCAEAQDEQPYRARLGDMQRREKLAAMKTAGAAVAQTVTPALPKKKRGRPRKDGLTVPAKVAPNGKADT